MRSQQQSEKKVPDLWNIQVILVIQVIQYWLYAICAHILFSYLLFVYILSSLYDPYLGRWSGLNGSVTSEGGGGRITRLHFF